MTRLARAGSHSVLTSTSRSRTQTRTRSLGDERELYTATGTSAWLSWHLTQIDSGGRASGHLRRSPDSEAASVGGCHYKDYVG